jgi:hypothetical protein
MNVYYEVRKTVPHDELSFETMSSREAENYALDLERRGFQCIIYRIERDTAVDHTKKN